MQLTDTQIQSLYKFVESKYVRYIDVQHEIVDHLACAIEDKMQEQPSLSFESALSQVYSQYPITGFAVLVKSKEKALRTFWKRKLWELLKNSFTDGSIIAIIPIAILCYSILTIPYGYYLLLFALLCTSFYVQMKFKKIHDAGQKLLITQILLEYSAVTVAPLTAHLITALPNQVSAHTFPNIIFLTIFHSIFFMAAILNVRYLYPLVSQKLDEYEVKLG